MADITVYTTPTCGYCKMLKQYLQSQSLEYDERDIVSDESAYEEVLQKSEQIGVPVIDIRGEIIVGFNKGKIESVLKEHSLIT